MRKYFIETSVLLASLLPAHPNYKRANKLLRECRSNGTLVCLSTHVIAELYANLSNPKFAKSTPIGTVQAADIIKRMIDEMQTVVLNEADYFLAIDRCAEHGLVSGVIYDALHY